MPLPQPAATAGDTSWFQHDRFGLFIHWGLYALGARHEWLQHREAIPTEVYRKYFDHFDPDLYDPELWADAAADAGMKYFVITTKHHEGFCLWDSALTDFKVTKTPYGKDLLQPMCQAFNRRGLRTGLYHSLIDWHHPDYVIDPYVGPYREAPNRAELNQGRDQNRYADYLHGQVRELLMQFGNVDIMWFDFSYTNRGPEGKGRTDWRSEELVQMVRELAPGIILDDRLDLPGAGDILTPEQFQPRAWPTVGGQPVVWEACQTIANSWGYHRDEACWRSTENLLLSLIDSVSKGGNLLLNVGPTGRGEIDARALERLRGIGAWMHHHSRSIYGCTQAPDEICTPRDCRLTYNPDKKRLYVHLITYPYKQVYIDGLQRDRVAYAQLLHDASEVALVGLEPWQYHHAGDRAADDGGTAITLPLNKPPVTISVIEIFLKD